MQKLADKVPGQLEGALAVARAALDAREFATARAALAPYLSAPTRRVATLMAEIEEAEHGDEGRVREWMGRAMRAVRRSGVDRRRRGVRALDAGVAERTARRLRMEVAAGRDRRQPAGDRSHAAAAGRARSKLPAPAGNEAEHRTGRMPPRKAAQIKAPAQSQSRSSR